MRLLLKHAVIVATVCSPLAAGTSSSGKWWIRPNHQAGQDASGDPLASGILKVNTDHSANRDEVMNHGYSFAEYKTEHFDLLYRNRDASLDLVADTGSLLEKSLSEFCSGYRQAGFQLSEIAGPLSWLVFDHSGQYREFARTTDAMDSPYLESYYSARNNHVVLMQLATTCARGYQGRYSHVRSVRSAGLTVSGMDRQTDEHEFGNGGMLDVRRAVHEAAHQLAFNTGLQKRGVLYPMWVSEGVATNCEADSVEQIGVAAENLPRQRQLLRAHSNGRLMPLREFVTMVQIPPEKAENANDLYAQCWAVFNFLYKTRRPELRSYMTTLAGLDTDSRSQGTMCREFTAAFGQISQLERPWSEFISRLRDGR